MTIIKNRQEDWDYYNAFTKRATHRYHNYPAMMIPQVAERLITTYGKNARLLFDPYCGTGTSLVEANLQGINAIGTDLNPLARLIAETKTSVIDLKDLDKYLNLYNDETFLFHYNLNGKTHIPVFKNIDFWFSKPVQKKLAFIKDFIDKISDKKIKKFFYVAFSETVRESSYTRNGEFKLYRMTERQRKNFNPDVFGMMRQKLMRNRKGLIEFIHLLPDKQVFSKIESFNTVYSTGPITEQSVDIVVTSPPYGDSRTTVAYGQFSRLSNQWLGIENAHQLDNELMGGKKTSIQKFGIKKLDHIIEKISQIDPKRASEVYSFYADYKQSIKNVAKTIKAGGYACYVVGNRTVKGIRLPTDEFTKIFFEQNGFSHIETYIRKIPHKRMPKKNSPTNIPGKTQSTMNNEYIVIMKKLTANS